MLPSGVSRFGTFESPGVAVPRYFSQATDAYSLQNKKISFFIHLQGVRSTPTTTRPVVRKQGDWLIWDFQSWENQPKWVPPTNKGLVHTHLPGVPRSPTQGQGTHLGQFTFLPFIKADSPPGESVRVPG